MKITFHVHHYNHTVDEKAIEKKLDALLDSFNRVTKMADQLDKTNDELKVAVIKNKQQ